MLMNFIKLPTINIALLTSTNTQNQELEKLKAACIQYGAFYLSGFEEVAAIDLIGVLAESSEFFHSSSAQKNSYIASEENHYLGYRGIGSEFSELSHRNYEPCEQYKIGYLNDFENKVSRFGCEAIEAHAGIFKNQVKSYFNALEYIGTSTMARIALSLNLSEDYFTKYMSHPNHQFGLNYYPIDNNVNIDYGMSAHKDLCLLTFIAQDIPGLMLQDGDQEWKLVPNQANSLIVMLGEFMEFWTDEYYQSPMHQVIKSSDQDRLSLVYKLRPNYDAVIPVIAGINPNSSNKDRIEIHTGLAYDNKLKNIMYINK